MAQFTYTATTADGTQVRGKLRAQSTDRATVLLRSHGLVPTDLKLTGETSVLHQTVFGGKISTRDLILFSRQVASMIRAGVPILQALQALALQVDKPSFAKLLRELTYDIEGGESLSNALAKHPAVFSVFFLGVVRTGEASGRLSESLSILADYIEQNYFFVRKIRAALMYPVFVLTSVVIVVILMFAFVVPQLITLFAEANVRLPLPTRILIGITHSFGDYWYVMALIAVALAIIGRSYLRTPEGQYNFSTLLLRIPIISTLLQKVYLARLTSLLHTLFSSDVPILESLKLARESLGNKVYQTIMDDTAAAVKDGATISSVWEHEAYIPAMLTVMVGIGERSGEIEKSFKEAHYFFQRDVEEMLDSVTVLLEPLLVIVLGIGVGIVVAAVLLPIYNLVLVL